MAKKQKTLKDYNLNDLRIKLAHDFAMLDMRLEFVVVNPKVPSEHIDKFTNELTEYRNNLKEGIIELSKRFNAPAGYDNEI